MLKQSPIFSNFVVLESVSVAEAMRAITDNQRGTVIVIDDHNHVLGVVADGDIRRALLRGITLVAPVSKIININAVTLERKDGVQKMAEKIFAEEKSINVIPVVDRSNILVDILVRDPEERKKIKN